ncbi:DeoR/GlpR family DNA-binding transcription regulator [Siccirubricoccus sp. KC 17139]|uniref:DeoR/GlpR family DNA-binding transcription regulator n=1 Tax=Siccirubricoccus soli TaxID=2899147 RepID=A0ABT1D580_9PROT|nr:DeoR/GlpR family DNA-binding transcription regulator [Siccirubricoccus soli]MCO6417072.1 DeoR/GlpR family DNA-binding transcription regulator [Siccirubricoccus soli]MCP2683207.1 DeoR/GlpR family DNA-binding transcription regulator [Siccirubricoccus soli]
MPPRPSAAPSREQRHRRILAALAGDPTVRISALATEFGVSAETVRRDIEALSRAGAVRRTYGGASVTHAAVQPVFQERERIAVAERARIGVAAAALVPDGAALMIDAGSTTAHLARALAARDFAGTVLTNSLAVAEACTAAAGIRILLCPGELYAAESAVYGAETQAFLARFNADLAFLGASGLTEEGISDVESRAAWVKRAMLARAARRVLLIDAGKFGMAHLERVAGLEALTELVTDAAPPPPIAAALAREKVQVILAPPSRG